MGQDLAWVVAFYTYIAKFNNTESERLLQILDSFPKQSMSAGLLHQIWHGSLETLLTTSY